MCPLHITFAKTCTLLHLLRPSSYDILLRRMYPLHMTFYWDVCTLFIWHFTETYVPSSYDILLRRMYPLHMTFYWDVCILNIFLFIWHETYVPSSFIWHFTETYVSLFIWHFTYLLRHVYNILLRHMCPLHMSFYWCILHMTFYWDVCALFI